MGEQGAESRLVGRLYSAQAADLSLVPRPVVHMWQRSTPAASLHTDFTDATYGQQLRLPHC
jgi:hypothetical protein